MAGLEGKHVLSRRLLDREVKVLVVGAGGTGSHIVSDLAVLSQTMLDLGREFGLSVTVMDDDVVQSANVGRARFYEADCGMSKADVLVNRVNMCLGTRFKAVHKRFGSDDGYGFDVVIGCVDTRASRRSIWESLKQGRGGGYWLDLGNGSVDGQVILGQAPGVWEGGKPRLPCVVDLYPELLNADLDPVDDGPSCSRREALAKQSAFVNKAAAMHGICLLSKLLTQGVIDHHAVFFNVETGRSAPLPCSESAWKRFGYEAGAR